MVSACAPFLEPPQQTLHLAMRVSCTDFCKICRASYSKGYGKNFRFVCTVEMEPATVAPTAMSPKSRRATDLHKLLAIRTHRGHTVTITEDRAVHSGPPVKVGQLQATCDLATHTQRAQQQSAAETRTHTSVRARDAFSALCGALAIDSPVWKSPIIYSDFINSYQTAQRTT